MKHAIQLAAIALGVAVLAPTASAQDAAAVDPDHYTVVFENDEVRVLRVHYGPDEISVMHEHPGHVAIPLSATVFRMHLPDGSAVDVPVEDETPIWADATTHQPHNLGDEPAGAILVEVKKRKKMDKEKHADGHEDHDKHEDHDDAY